jgi:hypothetical protein
MDRHKHRFYDGRIWRAVLLLAALGIMATLLGLLPADYQGI